MDFGEIQRLVTEGESETLELKKSTAELPAALHTICAFLNAEGGGAGRRVVIGATPSGKLVGQDVSDNTQRDIAQALRRLEPAARVDVRKVPLPDSRRAIIVLEAVPAAHLQPFTFEGRPYQRIGTTTSAMPQERYQQLLLNRIHGQIRWETAVTSAGLESLDHEQILRTVRSGVASGRLPETTGQDVSDILDRLDLRCDGRLTNAAIALFGIEPALRNFTQCQIRLARFRGTTKA